jgi:hypothetical protein
MYSTCLFCNGALGANQVIERFPVGRRLAFDQRRGRLWVVCRRCEKWNLTPLEERWEAIEASERLFRDTRKRVSTDHIGLAKLSEGLELVRIGEPQRPEFAAWRYGDQFGRRRRRANLFYGSLTILGVASLAASVYSMAGGIAMFGAVGGLNGVAQWIHLGHTSYRRRRVVARIDDGGTRWNVRGKDAPFLRLVPDETSQGWGIEVPCAAGPVTRRLTIGGAKARRLAASIVPAVTADGGSAKEIRGAVSRIEEHGDPERYLRWIARNQKRVATWRPIKDPVTGRKKMERMMDTLPWQGIEAGLAVEMAVNEENERIALEGELALLELAWKEAEEIAAIADRLTLPAAVETGLAELRKPGRPPRSQSDSNE